MDRVMQAYQEYLEAKKIHDDKAREFHAHGWTGSDQQTGGQGPGTSTEAAAEELLRLSRIVQQKYEAYLDLRRLG